LTVRRGRGSIAVAGKAASKAEAALALAVPIRFVARCVLQRRIR
jgi:hypothetical protein